jgi:hypothetical protein
VIRHYADMSHLWRNTVRRMWHGTIENGGIDFVASVDTVAYNNLLLADSMAFDIDLGRDLWLNRQRWTRLVRQYLDLSDTRTFIDRAADIGLGEGKRGVVTQMPCASVRREAKKHRWGNCMLGFTYRGLRKWAGEDAGPTIAMHSRVSYVAYIGGLDLALACVLAREIGDRIEVPFEEFRFAWYIDALQFHGFKSLPLLYKREFIKDLEKPELRTEYPTIKIVGRWWDEIVRTTEEGKPLEEIKYGPLRRVTRRYREYCDEQFLPSVTLDSLTLSPLYR